jgi:hypothetical protein
LTRDYLINFFFFFLKKEKIKEMAVGSMGVVSPLPSSIITEGRKPRGFGWAIT